MTAGEGTAEEGTAATGLREKDTMSNRHLTPGRAAHWPALFILLASAATFHRTFCPSPHAAGGLPPSGAAPVLEGPRHCGQS